MVPILRRLGFARQRTTRVLGSQFLVPDGPDPRPVEPWLQPLLQTVLGLVNGTFVDVGVNVGQTLLLVAAIDPKRRYVGFEPNPQCSAFVETLIRINHLDNATLVPVGLSDRTDVLQLELFFDEVFDSAASIVPNFRSDHEVKARMSVAVFRPSDLPPDLFAPPISVVKIDVEGAEASVLRGLWSVIERDRPFIFVEILPCYSADNLARLGPHMAIEAMVRRLGFAIMRIDHKNAPPTLQRIEKIGVHADMSLCEYILAPAEKLSVLDH